MFASVATEWLALENNDDGGGYDGRGGNVVMTVLVMMIMINLIMILGIVYGVAFIWT